MTAKITGVVIDKGTQKKKDGSSVVYTALFIPQDGDTVKVTGLDVDLEKLQYKELSVMVNIRAYNSTLYINSI